MVLTDKLNSRAYIFRYQVQYTFDAKYLDLKFRMHGSGLIE